MICANNEPLGLVELYNRGQHLVVDHPKQAAETSKMRNTNPHTHTHKHATAGQWPLSGAITAVNGGVRGAITRKSDSVRGRKPVDGSSSYGD